MFVEGGIVLMFGCWKPFETLGLLRDVVSLRFKLFVRGVSEPYCVWFSSTYTTSLKNKC